MSAFGSLNQSELESIARRSNEEIRSCHMPTFNQREREWNLNLLELEN